MKIVTLLLTAVTILSAQLLWADTVPLFAGQNIQVGTVTVNNDGTTLHVTYTVDFPGWYLTETHLAVEDDPADFPQTRKTSNPIPGKFEFKEYHDPPVVEYTYDVDISDKGSPVYIAAHAVVSLLNESCIDFESDDYQEKDQVMTVTTPFGDVQFGMVNSTPLVGLLPGDPGELTPVVDEYPVIAAPDTKPPLDNIVGFTVNMANFGGSDTIRDDYVRDDRGTGAGGKMLTDPPDLSQSPLLQHAYSRLLAIMIDVSGVTGLQSLEMVGIDLDHTEVWHFQYFDENDILINENIVGPGTPNDDGAAFPVTYWDPATKKVVIWGEQNLGQRERIGFALDNICIGTFAGDETAWGDGYDGTRFSYSSWGTYFEYTPTESQSVPLPF